MRPHRTTAEGLVPRSAKRDGGFTLLEIVITAAILVVVMASIYGLFANSSQFYATTVSLEHIQEQARRVVDEIAEELRMADQATLVISTVNGSSQIRFRKITGVVAGVPQWSTDIIWNWQTSAVDANGNLVADEGRVVRTLSGLSITKCHNVAQAGLSFTRTGDAILVRLTLIGTDARNKLIQTFAETSITMRNSST